MSYGETCDTTVRQSIRKAERYGVIVEAGMEFADDFYEQLRHVFAVQNSVPPFGVDRVRAT